MNIDEMQAGPEMDALVAENVTGLDVLGITPCTRFEGSWDVPLRPCTEWGTRRPVYLRRPDTGGCCCEVREPEDHDYWGHIAMCLEVVPCSSVEMAPAWQVVEAMMSKGAAVHIDHWDGNTCPDTTWEVIFVSPWFRGEASCHTAPLAICRAALRAVADAKKLEVFSGQQSV